MTPSAPENKHHRLEILAPAGGPDALKAALDAGADALYFGLKRLNARRGATNFAPEDLASLVSTIHAAGAKAYLTLNIDLVQRELGLAVRTLQLASAVGVDAVLVRDPALLLVRRFFPSLAFHFSTQAAVSSSAGVLAAQALGISRVVLARELSATEISAAAVPGVELEVFVQGALCFCCSGRCLLSSWVGGRSGNRGACASPCRVPWTTQDGALAPLLSMHDLCLVGSLPELLRLGVASLKIEGRLKSAVWVRDAVTLYRRALTAEPAEAASLLEQAAHLGDYTGRKLTDGYFTGRRECLTGDSGRVAARDQASAEAAAEEAPEFTAEETVAATDAAATAIDDGALRVAVMPDERGGTLWTVGLGGKQQVFRIPPQRVAKAKRAVGLAEVLEQLQGALVEIGAPAASLGADDTLAELLLPRSAGNKVIEDMVSWVRLSRKQRDGIVRGVALPAPLQALLSPRTGAHPANCRHMGDEIDCFRLNSDQLGEFLATNRDVSAPLQVCCSPLAGAAVPALFAQLAGLGGRLAAVAMPSVIYEAQLPAWRALLARLAAAALTVEVNSWDGWQLAHAAGCTMEAGPGLAVMNALAARQLFEAGCGMVMASCELDQEQLEDLCGAMAVPLSLTVFSYLPLMMTRAELPVGSRAEDHAVLRDSRQTALSVRREGPLNVLYAQTALDWRALRNPTIAVARLVADLRAAPRLRWPQPTAAADDSSRFFNYDRRLR